MPAMHRSSTATDIHVRRDDGRGDVLVRRLAVDDDAEVAAAHAALVASRGHQRPWAKRLSLREVVVDLRSASTVERLEPWVALVDGELAGVAMHWFPLLDNTRLTWAEVDVDPRLRRRGAGGALVEQLVDRTREEGRSTVLVESHVPDTGRADHPHVRFAERHGFTWANTEIRRLLDLPLDPVRLAGLAMEAARRHEGYRVESYVGLLPESLQQSYCDCSNLLGVDAPTGAVDFEAESLSPTTYVEQWEHLTQQGRTTVHTVAVAPSGEVVGYNDLVVSADDPDEVMQWGTLVRREHRGRRLGMAVKVRGLQELASVAPTAKRVQTCNAEQNAQMVGVNEELGFRRVEALLAYQRHVRD
ncbi:GNAT family N-acetyltransferase [Pedococcus sp. KACC 23699]|uniref:GNAT family N-acetyltransferase n=1 Tax=Pedococcus sp. KACC 23699 TaxID=3149228 RepID=A0AAU7JUT9_9MICO